MRQAVIRSGLEALYFSGAHWLLRGLFGGVGAILTLHHVRPARPDGFQPNRLLEVTPDFLDAAITGLKGSGFEIVSLDQMHERLVRGEGGNRFACLTFDDGYRDNLIYAYPVLKRHNVPFTIYVPTSFPEARGDLWWLTLEEVVARNARVLFSHEGVDEELATGSVAEKYDAFAHMYWRLRAIPDETVMRETINALAARHGIDPAAQCKALCMTWDEIARIAADPLATIGAHTVDHLMLRKASDDEARRQMSASADAIERAVGERPAHFSYPVGDPTSAGPREFAIAREVGFKTAVTTRPGVLFREHRDHLTALPRISLNGEFQRLRYVKVLASGAATAMWNGFRRIDAA